MTIYSFGSINIDKVYAVPHQPAPGETLGATGYGEGLGGKGANQSVAAARAGADVRHIGMVGPEGGWVVEKLAALGVGTQDIGTSDGPSGHAVIYVDAAGENTIVTFAGANREQTLSRLETALAQAGEGDTLILQNEVNLVAEAARMARAKGVRVIYSAAPFRPDDAVPMLPLIDMLALNEVEAAQLEAATGTPLAGSGVARAIVTRGAQGATWHDFETGEAIEVAAFTVTPVDTTGAGDCFIGTVAAALDAGLTVREAMRRGAAASAIQVTRHGAGDVMPDAAEVDEFLAAAEAG